MALRTENGFSNMANTTLMLACTMVGLVIGGAVVFLAAGDLPDETQNTVTYIGIVAFAGAFGGFLYTVRHSTLELPSFDDEGHFKLGCLADFAFGVGGAMIIFLVTPGLSEGIPLANANGASETTNIDWIELIAVATVGGYAGRALMNNAADSIARKDVDKKIDCLRSDFQQKIQKMEWETGRRGELLSLMDRQLDLQERPAGQEEIGEVLAVSRSEEKHEVLRVAEEAFLAQPHRYAERVKPVLLAFCQAESERPSVSSFAMLARCCGELDQWSEADVWIDKAIERQKQRGLEELAWHHEFKARCLIELCDAFQEGHDSPPATVKAVKEHLALAYPHGDDANNSSDETIQEWIKRNMEETVGRV